MCPPVQLSVSATQPLCKAKALPNRATYFSPLPKHHPLPPGGALAARGGSSVEDQPGCQALRLAWYVRCLQNGGQGSPGQCRGGCGHHREPRKKPGSPLGLGPIYQPGLVLVHSRKGTCTPVLFPRTSLGPLHCLFSLAAAPSPALQRDSFASFRSLLREASPTAAPPSLSLHPALCFFIALPPT